MSAIIAALAWIFGGHTSSRDITVGFGKVMLPTKFVPSRSGGKTTATFVNSNPARLLIPKINSVVISVELKLCSKLKKSLTG
jgi:hypothetical protein